MRYAARMTSNTFPLLLAAMLSATASTGCCKACSAVSGIAKEIKGPDATEGERLVKERVEKDKQLRKRICGVDTRQLVDLVVKKTPSGYSIQGTPIEKAKAPAPKADAGLAKVPLVDPKQALVCAAVVSVLWDAKDGPSGTTLWAVQRLDVDEITTPGAEFKRPVSSDWD